MDKHPDDDATGKAAEHNDVEDNPNVDHPETMLYDPPPEESVFSQQMNTPVAHPIKKAEQPDIQHFGLVVFTSHISKDEAELLIESLTQFAGPLSVLQTEVRSYNAKTQQPTIEMQRKDGKDRWLIKILADGTVVGDNDMTKEEATLAIRRMRSWIAPQLIE